MFNAAERPNGAKRGKCVLNVYPLKQNSALLSLSCFSNKAPQCECLQNTVQLHRCKNASDLFLIAMVQNRYGYVISYSK